VHGYWSIDLDILITIAVERLPSMVDQLRNAHDALRPLRNGHAGLGWDGSAGRRTAAQRRWGETHWDNRTREYELGRGNESADT
jgi:hypothetical protein